MNVSVLRPRILLLISGGWAVRNYIRSGLVDLLSKQAEVIVMLPSGDSVFEEELRSRGLRVEFYLPYSVPRPLSFLNVSMVNGLNRRLGLWHPTFWRWVKSVHPLWKRPYLEVLRFASVLCQNKSLYRAGRQLHDKWVESFPVLEDYVRLFEDVRPDIVVSSNPFDWSELPLSLVAARLHVPTVTAIVSWDNLSYKGFPLTRFTRYMVWSDLMKRELLRIEPQLDLDQIQITGTPQFDFHLSEELIWTREEFFGRIGGDPTRPLITYSACADLTFSEEPEVVAMLWQAIEQGDVIDNPQLLIRLHPHDKTDRFDRIRQRCPSLLIKRPWKHNADRFWWFTPTRDDLALLSNTLRYSDISVNAFSTIVLDSAIFDKPIVCVAFSSERDSPAADYLRHSSEIGHCQYLSESKAVRVAFSLVELISHLNSYLSDPSAERELRHRMVEQICGPVDGTTKYRMVDCILSTLKQ
ncbi:hypothetical protein MYX78_08680 [Acidobacteria bacterium AH-259-G07]|nr:hypothetical protein [Acidobacteria bacterium AH-259-G07]